MDKETDVHDTNNNHNKISMEHLADAFLESDMVCYIFITVPKFRFDSHSQISEEKLRHRNLSCPMLYKVIKQNNKCGIAMQLM